MSNCFAQAVYTSLLSLVAMASVLIYTAFGPYSHYFFGGRSGFQALVFFYALPWFIFACWLVITTFLHHNQPGQRYGCWLVSVILVEWSLRRWYNSEAWTYVKVLLLTVQWLQLDSILPQGNLSTVDRSYFPFDFLTHNIGTHIVSSGNIARSLVFHLVMPTRSIIYSPLFLIIIYERQLQPLRCGIRQ